jgi:hypothetical protein
MKERSKEKRRFWKKYTEGSSSKPRKEDPREGMEEDPSSHSKQMT